MKCQILFTGKKISPVALLRYIFPRSLGRFEKVGNIQVRHSFSPSLRHNFT